MDQLGVKPRVLHITRDYPPVHTGGISTAVHALLREWAGQAGTPHAVISFDHWRGKRSKTAPAVASTEIVHRVHAISDALEFASQFEPDLLHVHHGTLWEFARRLEIPAVLTVHVVQHSLNRIQGVTEETQSLVAQRRALHEAARVIAPSQRAARALLDHYPALEGRLDTVGFGIHAAPVNRDNARDVLHVGRFGNVKGTADLFAAFRLVLDRRPETRFVIAGGLPASPRHAGSWQRRLEHDHVRYTGWVPHEELASLFEQAAVFVSPSRGESFGLTVLEAMAAGVPVAATRTGETFIEHEMTGLLCDPEQPGPLADAIVRLLDDRLAAEAMAASALRVVRDRYGWADVIAAHRACYALAPGAGATAEDGGRNGGGSEGSQSEG